MSIASAIPSAIPTTISETIPGEYSPLIELGTDLLEWWDASSGVSLSGTAVTAWAGRKNGYSVSQATNDSRPTFSLTSFNGKPGLTFDGTDDELTGTDAALLAAMPADAEPSEIWAVVQQAALAADTTERMVFSAGNAAVVSRAMRRGVAAGVNRAKIFTGLGGSPASVTDGNVDLSSRHLIRGRFTATDIYVSVDGNAETTNPAISDTDNVRIRIGANTTATANNFWEGIIRDVMVTRALSADKAAALEEFLLARREI